jgi:hypothetical protein
MDKAIIIIGLLCSLGIVILLGIESMSNFVKLPIVALMMVITAYCLARKSKETKSKKIVISNDYAV